MQGEPVMVNGFAALLFVLFGGWLTARGVNEAQIVTVLSGLVAGCLAVLALLRARRKVTPIAPPAIAPPPPPAP